MGDPAKVKVLMTQQEIAEASGHSQSAIHYILKGDRRPSIPMAEDLEKATGICREAWLFPERHWNPYVPFFSSLQCGVCHRREVRQKKVIEIAFQIMEESPDLTGLRAILEMMKTFNAWPEDLTFSFGKVHAEHWEVLVRVGKVLTPEIITKDQFPCAVPWVCSGKSIYIPYAHDHHWLPAHFVVEHEHIKKHGLKSVYVAHNQEHRFAFHMTAFHSYVVWTPEMLERWQWFAGEIKMRLDEGGAMS